MVKTQEQSPSGFDEEAVLHEIMHLLPSQTPLKDFIHHNTLHAYQDRSFFDAIFDASAAFGYQVTLPLNDFRKLYQNGRIQDAVIDQVLAEKYSGAEIARWKERMLHGVYQVQRSARVGQLRSEWKKKYAIDLDGLVQPRLFRIIGSYLDQGVSLRHFPNTDDGLISAIRALEQVGSASFFDSSDVRTLLHDKNLSISGLLQKLVGKVEYYSEYLSDQQFSHPGWSGLVQAIEGAPHSILYDKHITFHDFVLLELLLELDVLNSQLGNSWNPIATHYQAKSALPLTAHQPRTELEKVLMYWQKAFEWSYYDSILRAIRTKPKDTEEPTTPSFIGIFCIDERECSLRRHLEAVEPGAQTLGCPGFFGVEFFFQPEHGKFYEKLCPAPVTPKYLIKEYESGSHRGHEVLYSKKSHTVLQGLLFSFSLGLVAAGKLALTLFRPKMSPAISDAFAHMHLEGKLLIENTDPSHMENGLQVGFTVNEMAVRVEGLLRNIGLVQHFPEVVYIVAHGSSSANNPHHGAYDCGACSGRPGSVNARVFAFMANHKEVRKLLKVNGLEIPEKTQFVGALHDTAADQIAYYDEAKLTAENAKLHKKWSASFEEALDLNAKERARRFASIDINQDIKQIREAIRKRSVSMFEPRPELGHGTNALCFVGNRSLTRHLFLDRRAFMNSYDYRTDPEGKYLLNVMRPLPPVCGGINLEYYFSRVDNWRLGAGPKLSHNIVGLIGVVNSSDGDLRSGLPMQMTEPHDPIRLLILVEHKPEVILRTIQSDPALYDWFEKDWVLLLAVEPESLKYFIFKLGEFVPYEPGSGDVQSFDDIHKWLQNTREMRTNHIADATHEHLEVAVIQSPKNTVAP